MRDVENLKSEISIEEILLKSFKDKFVKINEKGWLIFKDGFDTFEIFKSLKNILDSPHFVCKRPKWLWIESGSNSYAGWLDA